MSSIVSVRKSIDRALKKNGISSEQVERSFHRLLDEDPELKCEILKVMDSRETVISKLKSMFKILRKLHLGVNIVKVVGTLISIVGIVTLTGIGMASITAGSSLIVSLVGGALVIAGSSICALGRGVEYIVERKHSNQARLLLKQDSQQIQVLEEKFPKFKSIHPDILCVVNIALVDLKEGLLRERKYLFAPVVRKVAAMKKYANTKMEQLEDKIYIFLQEAVEELHTNLLLLHTDKCDSTFMKKVTDITNTKLKLLINRVYFTIKKSIHWDDPSLKKFYTSDFFPLVKDAFTLAISNPRKIGKLSKQIRDIVKLGLSEVVEAQKVAGFVERLGVKVFRCALAGRVIAIFLQTAVAFFTAVGLVIDIGSLGVLLYEIGAGSASKDATKVLDHAYRLEIEQTMWRRALKLN